MEVAAYRAVAADLRRRIEQGEFVPGEPLPSRADIARRYGVGSNVAAAAVRSLETDGLVKGRAGVGVFVREPSSSTTMARAWTHQRLQGRLAVGGERDSSDDRSVRSTPHSRTEPAGEDVARRLGIAPADLVVRSEYLLARDGRPAMFCVSWEPLSITGGTPVALPGAGPMAGQSVIARMSSIGLDITRSTETVTARLATREEADALDVVQGAPVAAIERTYYADARALETADLVIPGERFRLAYEIPAVSDGVDIA
ncbi:GntR family transcriptional regulator [Streptomyces bluensis]|uniref:GntR family transcriptional regulator n=1 Tax=Streptomyces bluensis TaxID=33897 RepID=UPI00331B5113